MTATTAIEVKLFAGAQSLADADVLVVKIPHNATAGEVLRRIGMQCQPLQSLLPACRLAVNLRYVEDDFVGPPDASLALIPPVSGG
ncbi:MAG: MoaD/ThiS family protein [Pirellulaceae bacterium]